MADISADVSHLLTLNAEVERLRAGIREHRDARGDDRCWRDDVTLYQLLPEGFTPPAHDSFVELERCKQFIACRQNPSTLYISPQRRIEELEAALKDLNHRRLCEYQGCMSEWVHERKRGEDIFRLCGEHNALLFPSLRLADAEPGSTTLERSWDVFAENFAGIRANEPLRFGLMAFYAGAQSFCAAVTAAMDSDVEEADFERLLDAILSELAAALEEMKL
jgi:hypothetical protein